MAAFRGRSLLRLGLDVVDGEVDSEAADDVLVVTGLLFWASFSVILILVVSCDGILGDASYCPVSCGGLVSFTSGTPPAIEVSGMPEFRGGAGGGSRACGRYAAIVCSSLFDERPVRALEENVRGS